MPAETAPRRSRKKPASGSTRKWKGRSGSPSGSVICPATDQTACSPKTDSARPASAPKGNARRRAKKAWPNGRGGRSRAGEPHHADRDGAEERRGKCVHHL